MPEIADPPPARVSPFSAALDAAFKEPGPDAADGPGEPKAEAVPKKAAEKTPKEPLAKADTPKDTTPRELFKKPDAAKEPEAPKSTIDEIAAPEFKDAKGKAGWDAIKKEAKAHEAAAKANDARAKELEAKLAEFEPLKTQLADRDKLIAEQSELVARVRVESHPDYIREFVDGRAALIKKVEGVIADGGGDPKGVEAALNLRAKARVDALAAISEDMPAFQQGRLGELVNKLADLDERAEEKRAKSKESYAELQEQERKREIEGRSKKFKDRLTEFDDTTRRLRTSLEVLNKAEGHEAWNSRGDGIVKEAREFIEAHPDADIEAELLSRALPVYRDLFMQADAKVVEHEKKIAELESELKAIHGKSPSLESRRSVATKDGDSRRPFSNALAAAVGGGE